MGELQWISIGKLAKASGFAVERIRMWELRYGAPASHRLASGHRRYNVEEVERLHLVREALARGKRPRHVVALKREALLQLLGASDPTGLAARYRAPQEIPGRLPWTAKAWIEAVGKMDDALLDRQLYEHWLELGSLNFLVERAQPFAAALALSRQSGDLGVAEERFGSEKLGDFLSSIWRRLNENNADQPVLLSTFPEDQRSLDLQMTALVAALAGLHVIYLGPAAPLDDLISAAQRQKAKAVLLTVSAGSDPQVSVRHLAYLRVGLPPEVLLGVGGAGAPSANPDFRRFQDLPDLFQWARTRGPGRPAPGLR
jgi:hypothetical protein